MLHNISLVVMVFGGANVGYKFNDSLSLRVGVNNILDKRIYRNAGTARTYNERGRSYFANLKYSF